MSGTRVVRRLPFGPVDAMVGTAATFGWHPPGESNPAGLLCSALGYSRKALSRFRSYGLTIAQADQFAIELGVHPMTLWGDDWLAA